MNKNKFRAWDSNFKKWIRLNGSIGNSFWREGELCGAQEYILFEQYADLEDIYAKQYCQGDIFVDTRTGYHYKVVKESGAFWADPVDYTAMCEDYCRVLLCHINVLSRIIGNVRENPELLKEAGA